MMRGLAKKQPGIHRLELFRVFFYNKGRGCLGPDSQKPKEEIMNSSRWFKMMLLGALLFKTLSAYGQELCSGTVETSSGLVAGVMENNANVCVWRGIPYAEPPVGDLRWKAPQPAKAWTGVRPADKFGDRCVQASGFLSGGSTPGVGMSEDCLNLNIWRPKSPGKYPVMFWIHGGGYYVGAGNDPGYWGDRLAESGNLIVVTINYRLSLLGFMAHPDLRKEDPNNSTGGYGTLDQALALKWVHQNIAQFGGDPDQITIFGQSAGGASICSLIATPLTKGMFSRAIMESGLCELSLDLEDAYQQTRTAIKELGCGGNDLACMRGISAEQIIKKAGGSLLQGFIYMPCHDGYLLTGTPLSMIESGNYNRVALLAGTVLDEFGKAVKLKPKYHYTLPAQYEKKLISAFGMTAEQARTLVSLYPLAEYAGRPVEAMGRMFGADATMQCPTHRGLLGMEESGKALWFYRFDYHGMKYGKYLGSFHTAELPFVFNAFDRSPSKSFYQGMDLDQERELSRVMQGYWTNFAKSGNPNGPGLPEWKAFTSADQRVQILDTSRVENRQAQIQDRCQFWDGYGSNFVKMANHLIGLIF